jgi:hypothetical protein
MATDLSSHWARLVEERLLPVAREALAARGVEQISPELLRAGPPARRPVVTGVAAPLVRPRLVRRVGWVDGGLRLVAGHDRSVALGAPGGERGTP